MPKEKNTAKAGGKQAVSSTGDILEIQEKSVRHHHKFGAGDKVFFILDYLFFIIFTISCIFPFYYLFINTISDASLVSKGMINFVPKGINFDNYLA